MLRTLALALALVPLAHAQDSLDVTFRFLPDLTAPAVQPVRVFVPGEFNDWGPNTDGRIQPGAPSQATFVEDANEYVYTERLRVGESYDWKFHLHLNASGTQNQWITDPLATTPCTFGTFSSDCRVEVTDPMIFQPAREQDGTSSIQRVSASVFASEPVTALTFEVNGVERDGLAFYDAQTGRFSYDLPAPVPSGSQFKITATTSDGTVSEEIGLTPPDVVDAPRPAGLRDGITQGERPGQVFLSLFAPYKDYVYVLGDFSDWQPDENYLMKRDVVNEDSVYFWIELNEIRDNTPFQYLVDGQIRVADPYSELVLDPGNDSFIPDDVFPNLPAYPTGETTEIVGVLNPNIADPNVPAPSCDVSTYERPDQEELVIYELLVRDFLEDHSFVSLADTLDYLADLGVTAIQIMPVSEFDGNLSWGYNPAFHFALDKYYGTPTAFQHVVDEAHCRGMAVILDVVYNHATGQSPLIRLWNEGRYGSPTAENPYANTSARHPFNVFNDLNHDSPATRYWLDRANAFWLEEYGVDGFRFDLSKGFTQRQSGDVGAWNRYDQGRVDNLTRMADAIWQVDPEAHIILEHFADNPEEQVLVNYGRDSGKPGMMVWTKMVSTYNEATMGFHENGKSNLAGAYTGPGGRGFSNTGSVAIMEDHDEQRLMRKNLLYGAVNSSTGYSVRDAATAKERMGAAGAFFFTLPGPKMIWQWGELGYGFPTDECLPEQDGCPGGRTDARDDGWYYLENDASLKLYDTWSALIGLRGEHKLFTDFDTDVTLDLGRPDGTKRIVLRGDTMDAVVLGNFGTADQSIAAGIGGDGTWYDYFSGQTASASELDGGVTLAPGTFRIYTSNDIGKAVLTSAGAPVAAGATTLGAPAPHPVRDVSRLTFRLEQAGTARVDVYDALGRHVATLADGTFAAGPHGALVDATGWASGLYIVRLTTDTTSLTTTFVRAGR
jgi:glycosidase